MTDCKNRFIISIPFEDFDIWSNENMCKYIVKTDGLSLQYVENQTEDICKSAVQEDWRALQYVKNQTKSIRELSLRGEYYEDDYELWCLRTS